MSEELRRVFIYGRLGTGRRERIAAELVKIGGKLERNAGRASAVVLSHATLSRAPTPSGSDWPFAAPSSALWMSERALRRRLAGDSGPRGPYTTGDLARLSGLSPNVLRVLAAADLIAPVAGSHAYGDAATAKQIGQLLDKGMPLQAVVNAGFALGARGLRVSQVRLAAAPWGELVQDVGGRIVQLDGQFALVLDETMNNVDQCLEAAEASEAAALLDDAERWYRRAMALDKADPTIAFNLGNVLSAQSRVAEAVIAYKQALSLDPTFPEAKFNLAKLHEDRGQPEQAVVLYGEIVVAHPSYTDALYNAGRLLTTVRQFEKAVPLLDRFLALAPDDPDVSHARRMALLCRMEIEATKERRV